MAPHSSTSCITGSSQKQPSFHQLRERLQRQPGLKSSPTSFPRIKTTFKSSLFLHGVLRCYLLIPVLSHFEGNNSVGIEACNRYEQRVNQHRRKLSNSAHLVMCRCTNGVQPHPFVPTTHSTTSPFPPHAGYSTAALITHSYSRQLSPMMVK